jgi:hypothetical protein
MMNNIFFERPYLNYLKYIIKNLDVSNEGPSVWLLFSLLPKYNILYFLFQASMFFDAETVFT